MRFVNQFMMSTGKSEKLLLDSFGTDIWSAYSFRKLRSLYLGPCIRVRKDSDLSEYDIPFVGTYIKESDLISLSLGTTLRVITKYDQSGNGNHAIFAGGTAMPISINGIIIRTGNGLVTTAVAAGRYTAVHTGQLNNNSPKSVFSINNLGGTSGSYLVIGTTDNTLSTIGWRFFARFGNYSFNITSGSGTTASATGLTYTLPAIYSFTLTYNNGVNGVKIYRNGILIATGTRTGGTNRDRLQLYRDQADNMSAGMLEELIYSADKSTDRADIDLNQKNYYGI